jgi:hypothetical protein
MQTLLGNCYAGLLYGMGSIADAISEEFDPTEYNIFSHKHGTFGAIIGSFDILVSTHLVR